jgi:hypothetical protein
VTPERPVSSNRNASQVAGSSRAIDKNDNAEPPP